MVNLVPMDAAEFERYYERAVVEYAQEHVRSGRWSAEEALEQSTKQFQQLLPDGVATPNQYLYMVQDADTGVKVGILWFAVQKQGGQQIAFVYDVEIDPAFRRQGYGRQAFHALEGQVRALGLATIGLHVFGHNHGARALYESLGFVPTNINMRKSLSDDGR